jgi:transposase-like protein
MRDIRATISELYHQDLSEELISSITDTVNDEVKEWQNRPLEYRYPILYLDCIVIKVQENKSIINKSVYLALGIRCDGVKELLGLWIAQNEGAKFWLNVLTELNNRGLKEVFIACCDGLTGFPDAINAIYPECQVQSCIVHMVRNSLAYVPWKDRKIVAADLKTVYQADTEEIALQNLEEFAAKWDKKYPAISKSWFNRWGQLNTLFGYTADIRKVIYTTNAIESLNMTLRKVMKNKRVFPNDTSVFKTMYLAIGNISKRWTMPIRDWAPAYQQMLIKFGKI